MNETTEQNEAEKDNQASGCRIDPLVMQYTLEIWHPDPETGKLFHVFQHTKGNKRTYYSNGIKVLEAAVGHDGALIPGDKEFKGEAIRIT